jgi:hypothetical protein
LFNQGSQYIEDIEEVEKGLRFKMTEKAIILSSKCIIEGTYTVLLNIE